MNLYISPTSPYARIVRIVARDCGAIGQITEIIADKRVSGSDYFDITPLARVPALVVQGRLIADTRDIVQYFDAEFGGGWLGPETPLRQTYRHVAFGMLDGLAVWAREIKRDAACKARMRYEHERAIRALSWLDANCFACQDWNFSGVTLVSAVNMAQDRGLLSGDEIRNAAPDLMNWVHDQSARASVIATRPPAPSAPR